MRTTQFGGATHFSCRLATAMAFVTPTISDHIVCSFRFLRASADLLPDTDLYEIPITLSLLPSRNPMQIVSRNRVKGRSIAPFDSNQDGAMPYDMY
jgi:hypothetical protein